MQGRVHVMGNSLALKAKSAKGSYYVHAAICMYCDLIIHYAAANSTNM
jgi:hypothetical protein